MTIVYPRVNSSWSNNFAYFSFKESSKLFWNIISINWYVIFFGLIKGLVLKPVLKSNLEIVLYQSFLLPILHRNQKSTSFFKGVHHYLWVDLFLPNSHPSFFNSCWVDRHPKTKSTTPPQKISPPPHTNLSHPSRHQPTTDLRWSKVIIINSKQQHFLLSHLSWALCGNVISKRK